MPNKDWTGPRGQGPRTWAKRWKCQNSENLDMRRWNEKWCCKNARRWQWKRWKNSESFQVS